MKFIVYSTGHHPGLRNIADYSVYLDMSNMKAKTVDLANKTYTTEPGNTSKYILDFIHKESNGSLVVLTGDDPSVGMMAN